MNEIFKLFITFLSGSFVGSLLQNYFQDKKDKFERRKQFLEHQLQLYGPMYSLVVQNEDAFKRIKEISDASRGIIIDETKQEIEVQNAHIGETVLVNNEKLYKILNANLHFLDLDDIKLVTQFFRDYNYYKVEVPEHKGTKLPLFTALKIKQISFIRPEFIARIKQKFDAKQQELREIFEPKKSRSWFSRVSVFKK